MNWCNKQYCKINNYSDAYDKLHFITRNNNFSKICLLKLILSLPENIKNEILKININNYFGHNNLLDI